MGESCHVCTLFIAFIVGILLCKVNDFIPFGKGFCRNITTTNARVSSMSHLIKDLSAV